MNDDEQHLRLLSIFHYVVGSMMGLFACLPIVHLVIGVSLLLAPDALSESDGKGMPPMMATFMGVMFTVIPLMVIGLGWSMAACLIAAGRCLASRRHYTFCLVMAGIACMFIPFGTVLGVFTIIVLVRPSVKQLFDGTSSSGKPFG